MLVEPARPHPLGAHYDGAGTSFAVTSRSASRVQLCLLDDDGTERRVDLHGPEDGVWHGRVDGVGPGQRYGYRVHAAFESGGNPNKLLVDPYAQAVAGALEWNDAVFQVRQPHEDSAPYVPHSVVVNPYFDWSESIRPRTPWSDTVIYEAHVKGLTALHPDVPPELRGTYLGVACPPVIEHLQRLGVTAIELLPIQQFLSENRLGEQGLSNYWGYNPLAWLAPHNGYATADRGQQVNELKTMVRELHRAGIEVICDVVFNHTAEGGPMGPTLSLRGFDDKAYYRHDPADPSRYLDVTGCGNTVDASNRDVLRLVMDALRHWVTELHVDGFRFDLAVTLGRDGDPRRFDPGATFFDLVHQDPVLRDVKLIAEPWDIGHDGYQVGGFPSGWGEWNGRYRDALRDFWKGTDHSLPRLARRLTGSADLYLHARRSPTASVNFITSHDGFTATDLVAYEHKRNEANGEDNRDGDDHNRSWNCGVEGPSDDPGVNELRARQRRNLVASVLLSHGVPMLLGGDELGRTQRGNNNAYCQDNEISWVNWATADEELIRFVAHVTGLRRDHPVLRRTRWLTGRPNEVTDRPDSAWFTPSGRPMETDDWERGYARAVGLALDGRAVAPEAGGEAETA
ncbi:MAG: glycogen debranching protein GlgX, partial [Actinomycetota bacterium]|nr:glycogen debranching protein GlgX [Actinomycetota bacterium]